MNISELQSATKVTSGTSRESAANPEQVAKNRDLAKAVRTINEGAGTGAGSELRFSIDRDSGEPVIRIVDRVTDEVISQVPSERILRTAEALRELRPGDRFA